MASIEKRKNKIREMTVLDNTHLAFQCTLDDHGAILALFGSLITEYKRVQTASSKSGRLPPALEEPTQIATDTFQT